MYRLKKSQNAPIFGFSSLLEETYKKSFSVESMLCRLGFHDVQELLVSTNVVCERLSAMPGLPEYGMAKFVLKIP